MSAEFFARECRKALAAAALAERSGDIEYADRCGAVAGNKLDQAYHLGLREDKVTPIRCAVAGNKLAQAIRLAERESVIALAAE